MTHQHGFKVQGSRIFFTEQQVLKATESAPVQFKIRARNPEKTLHIGGAPLFYAAPAERCILRKKIKPSALAQWRITGK